MMDRRHFLKAATSIPLSAVAASSYAATKSPQKADSDIALLREIVTTLHPGLYRYASPSAIDAGLRKLERSWTTEPGLQSRYLNLSRFLATIKCGHSYANFFNQKKAVAGELFSGQTRLPFTFRWIGKQMVVLADQSGSGQLPRGTIVAAINDVPAGDMLAKLLPFARADGNNDAKRRALLSVSGADSIEFFDVFHGLLFDAAGGSHKLRIRKPGTINETIVDLPALTLEQRQGFIRKRDYRGDAPVWDWEMRDDGIAVLTMDGWALYNSKWDWQGWLNDRLDSLRGAKGLIIDIRENEGGNDCGDAILARLAAKDVIKPLANRLVRYRKVPAHLNAYLDTWDDSFRDWGDNVEPFDGRYFRQTLWEDPVLPAKGPRIDVPMVVLTSAQNSSATFQFASLCRASGIGTLLGETTGGNQRGINGGAFFFARLPESGIEFDVPLVGYFPAGRPPDAGITPNIAVSPTAEDIASSYDRQMQIAIAHLLHR
jgi:hypothetical protein